jgi:GNAT superfamily N-acetyltransferase
MGYDIIPYAPELDAEIARLQTHLWGDDLQRNAAYLRWKYTDNPYLDETLIQLAQHDGELVGMRGMFGTLWEVDDGTRHLLPYADDFVVTPAHRNRGVAGRIMRANLDEARRRGHRFVINLSAGPVTFVASLAAGWRSPGSYRQLDYHRAPSAPLLRLRSLAGKRLYEGAARTIAALAAGGVFDHLDAAAGRSSCPVAVERQARPRAMADLVSRLPWDGRIRHVRDERYFSWRFRNPLHEYRFLFAGGTDLDGYLVLQRYLSRWADTRLVNIADCEATNERVRADLLDTAVGRGRFAHLRAWSVGSARATADLLAARGFHAARADNVQARSSGLLVRRLDDSPGEARWQLGSRNALSIDDWDLRMIYSTAA